METKIVLIHATPLAIAPVARAFAVGWPGAHCMNLLEDQLSADRARAGALTPELTRRMVSLAQYGQAWGAQGVLFTCSAFGPAIAQAAQATGLPTLRPNEAMFREALTLCRALGGPRRVGLLTTFAPASSSMQQEWAADLADTPDAPTLQVACADGAMAALNAGDAARHDQMVLERSADLAGCDVLLLGQFSMAHTREAVARHLGLPVLSSPDSAVAALRSRLQGGTPAPQRA